MSDLSSRIKGGVGVGKGGRAGMKVAPASEAPFSGRGALRYQPEDTGGGADGDGQAAAAGEPPICARYDMRAERVVSSASRTSFLIRAMQKPRADQ